MALTRRERYFISAGELSGDLIGGDLVQALKTAAPHLEPFGIAGEAMERAGVEPVAKVADFSVMGVFEVARKLAELRMLEARILAAIDRRRPTLAVLIDNPGFHLRLAEQLRMRGIRVIQYVAPKLWAWGSGRIGAVRRNFDLVLGILPFEEKFFRSQGVAYQYVGCPLKDRTDKVMVQPEALGLEAGRPVVAARGPVDIRAQANFLKK